MKLWTAELAANTPALYETEQVRSEDKTVTAKFFALASAWTWYVVEASEEDREVLFFGYVDTGDECSEWGYFQLSELESLQWRGILRVERDLHFEPKSFGSLK
ncbi:DUF2958 domain-containing protein [Alicyclobacillus fastidiosus]|uniref:DUF2958 domain-containing protein n=1 Tax=Alicyclobacillus fastidiosus TaxID=392011 RepID=UPI0023E9095A|nr:DUF2958 domain-containing protein [Alicyclobacillus fastidiosus]GMA65957.1 hypothetical protein GCM10025859_63990 [Alicyclobacillus fastidiosus]GMA66177.1 hypothetical protein GCM10025859_66190 [Alicyclobacillus fastidiosus]